MVRRISIKRHLFAVSLAIIIFLAGLSFGSMFNKPRIDYLETSAKQETLNLESLQVQYLFLTSVFEDKKNCVGAQRTLDEGIYNLGILSNKLDNYIQDRILFDEEEFQFLKREYTLAQLRYWGFSEKIRSLCDYDSVDVLYFYSSVACDSCRTQGMILTHLKSKFKDKLMNFAFDYDFLDEPMIKIIRESYNITSVPTLIVEDKKYEGMRTEEELIEIICSSLKDEELCKDI